MGISFQPLSAVNKFLAITQSLIAAVQHTFLSYKNNGQNVAVVTVCFQKEAKSTYFSEFMPSNCQDLEPHDFLKDFVEVKDFKLNPNYFEHENDFNQLSYWKPILNSIVVSAFVGMVIQVIVWFHKISLNKISLNTRSQNVI